MARITTIQNLLLSSLLPLTALSSPVSNWNSPLPVDVVYDFPAATWIENLAVRGNGQILATQSGAPRVYLVDPFVPNEEAVLLHEFNETASILGVAEGAPDVFYVCTANYSSKLLEGYGQDYVYKIDMTEYQAGEPATAKVSEVATVSEGKGLDGLVYVPAGDRDLLFVTDFLVGVIWSVDVASGAVEVAINNTHTQSTGFGANGLKYQDGFLYFTNTQKESLIKVAIDSKGNPTGDYIVVTSEGFVPDDFALDVHGNAFIATFTSEVAGLTDGKDGIYFVSRSGEHAKNIAEVAGPTGAAFGRAAEDCNILYVCTTGGDDAYLTGEPITVSGKIMKVDLGRWSPNCAASRAM